MNLRPRKSAVALTSAAALMALLTACNGAATGAATVTGTASNASGGGSSSNSTAGGSGGATNTSPAGGGGAPSACRPANYTTKVAEGPASAGHSHFQVTLTAAPGYDPCQLAGSPTDVKFSSQGSDDGITAGTYGPQDEVVNFGPGHPVHFDIQVPNQADGTPADQVTFTLKTPDGVIPGESTVEGSLSVAAGTLIGPVQSGA
ncbi:hypothetical protein [Streptomyces sp. NPDC006012]|uniref:hypothetical protein n=1 Tax=Streptomyces sp. NPDC006012 TaxID=3364739 RepID=UPI0036800590